MDYCEARMLALRQAEDGTLEERDLGLAFPDASPSSFDLTPDGEILFVDVAVRIYQLEPGPGRAS